MQGRVPELGAGAGGGRGREVTATEERGLLLGIRTQSGELSLRGGVCPVLGVGCRNPGAQGQAGAVHRSSGWSPSSSSLLSPLHCETDRWLDSGGHKA